MSPAQTGEQGRSALPAVHRGHAMDIFLLENAASFTGKPGWYGSFSSHQSVLNSLQSASFVVAEIFIF